MKKILGLVLALVLMFGMIACTPAEKINEKNKQVCRDVIAIIDSYVDGEIAIREAIYDIRAQEKEIDLFDDTAGLGVSADYVYTAMQSAMAQINIKELYKKDSNEKILESRNELADLAGEEKR